MARVYDFENGKEVFHFPFITKGLPNKYAISNSGSIVATGDQDGYIQLWDLKTGKEIKR